MLRDPGFPPSAVLTARIVLAVSLLVAAGCDAVAASACATTAQSLQDLRAPSAHQGGRIETYMEQVRRREAGEPVPLIDLLAEDALAVAETAPPETGRSPQEPARARWHRGRRQSSRSWRSWSFGGAGFGFGSRNLWFGATDSQRRDCRALDPREAGRHHDPPQSGRAYSRNDAGLHRTELRKSMCGSATPRLTNARR